MKIKHMLQDGRRLRNDIGQLNSNFCYKSNYTKVIVCIFDKFVSKIYKKSNKEYDILSTEVIGANESKMVLYTDGKNLYISTIEDFKED